MNDAIKSAIFMGPHISNYTPGSSNIASWKMDPEWKYGYFRLKMATRYIPLLLLMEEILHHLEDLVNNDVKYQPQGMNTGFLPPTVCLLTTHESPRSHFQDPNLISLEHPFAQLSDPKRTFWGPLGADFFGATALVEKAAGHLWLASKRATSCFQSNGFGPTKKIRVKNTRRWTFCT